MALLLVTGWPAYATDDAALRRSTEDKVERKLMGSEYGAKRHLRDGYRSRLEADADGRYAEHETAKYEGAECRWPMAFLLQCITSASP